MIRMRGYKTELAPTPAQIPALQQHVGAARHVYNWALATRMAYWELGEMTINAFSLNAMLTIYKHEPGNEWLYDVSNSALQSAIRNLCRAYDAFFRRVKQGNCAVGYPRFHSCRIARQSCTLHGQIRASTTHVNLPKLGTIKLKEHGYIPSPDAVVRYLAAHVSCDGGKWYVSVQVEEEISEPPPATGPPLGVHTGAKRIATLSTGISYPGLRSKLKHVLTIARVHARKQSGSARCAKAAARLNKYHAELARQREHALHQVSIAIARSGASIVGIESYNIQALLQKAKAAHEHPVARSLADAAMGKLRRQISYKCEWHGSQVVPTDDCFASMRTCSVCGNLVAKAPRSRFVCPKCRLDIDAELNAAMNVLSFVQPKEGNLESAVE